MGFLDFIALLIVAGLCGAIAQAILGYQRGGCLLSMGVGFLGALIGSWLGRALNLPELFVFSAGEVQFPIVWSIVGASIFIFAVNLINSRKRPRV
ncbi:MAG: GlsB/YeaQ/YmgE family stress response membrane protein [Balneolales bacterium]